MAFFLKKDKHIVKRMKEITEKWGLRESTCWKTEHINQDMRMGGIKTLFYTTLILIKDKKHYEFFLSLLALRKEAIYHWKFAVLTSGPVVEDEALLIHLKGFLFFFLFFIFLFPFFFFSFYFEQRKDRVIPLILQTRGPQLWRLFTRSGRDPARKAWGRGACGGSAQ